MHEDILWQPRGDRDEQNHSTVRSGTLTLARLLDLLGGLVLGVEELLDACVDKRKRAHGQCRAPAGARVVRAPPHPLPAASRAH